MEGERHRKSVPAQTPGATSKSNQVATDCVSPPAGALLDSLATRARTPRIDNKGQGPRVRKALRDMLAREAREVQNVPLFM